MSSDESGKKGAGASVDERATEKASKPDPVAAGSAAKRSGGAAPPAKGARAEPAADSAERVPKASEPEPKKRNWTAILIGTLVFFALVGSLAAWLQGKASRQPEVDELKANVADLEQQKSDLESRVAELQDEAELLEARRQVARAADELAEQNFGSSQEALNAAAEGLRNQGHGAIADRLDEVATTPTDDVTGPRNTILAIGRDLDRAIGR